MFIPVLFQGSGLPILPPLGIPYTECSYYSLKDYGNTLYCEIAPDFTIDPNGTELFRFPFAVELDGDTIAAADVVLQDGLTVDSSSIDGSAVNVILSGAQCGRTYRVTVRAVTDGGLVLDKTLRLLGKDN